MRMVASDAALGEAAQTVRNGGVITYPTEYCYGLGCDPDCVAAIRKILHIKKRSRGEGLILIAADIGQLSRWVDLSDAKMRERVLPTWPGPVTWLVPARPRVSSWLRGAHEMLAVRVTAHAIAADLCRRTQGPIVSTSANRTGQSELRSEVAVRSGLAGIDYILPGSVGSLEGPTEIRDARTGAVVRPATTCGSAGEGDKDYDI
jgi:L-threonylcarbamoyladenylate synthase